MTSARSFSSDRGSQVTPMIGAFAARARVTAPRTNGVMPLAEMPMTTSLRVGRRRRMARSPSSSSSSTPSFARCTAAGPPGHDRLRRVRVDAERRRQFRRLEHAKPAARAGADKDQPPAFQHRIGHEALHRARCAPSRAEPPRARFCCRESSPRRSRPASACRCRGCADSPLRSRDAAISIAWPFI